MNYLTAAVLGVIQGLTEFLPVSSTAHLLVAGRLLGYTDPAFTVMIQLGSVLAIMWLYRVKILDAIRGLPGDRDAQRFALMLFVAFVPAVLAGAFAADYVQTVLYESVRVIAVSFIVGGVVMQLVERFRPAPTVFDAERTPIARAFGVGMCQVLALIPGVSRSGATIVGGLLFGLSRKAATEFSFFLAVPTLMAAGAYQLYKERALLSVMDSAWFGAGSAAAFISAFLCVRWLLRYIGSHDFTAFAWYRIVFGIIVIATAFTGVVNWTPP